MMESAEVPACATPGEVVPSVRTHPAVSTQRHLPALDGTRGMAILLVMLLHIAAQEPAISIRLPAAVRYFCEYGWSGVDLFFVLSCYLITGNLLSAKGTPDYFKNFYARRILRIFPLCYAYLAFVFFVLPRSHLFGP